MPLKTAAAGTPHRQAIRVAPLVVLAGCLGCAPASNTDAVVPYFTTQPVTATVAVGAGATFNALAQGPPPPTYQWYRTDDAGYTWTLLAGATGASYTLPAAAIDDHNAWFEVVATNLLGFISSQSARLAVTTTVGQTAQVALAAPAVPTQLAPGPDGRLWFTCAATGQVGMLAPVTHAPTLVALPTATGAPQALAAGPDGRMWFTEYAGGKLGAMSLDGSAVTEYAAGGQGPAGLTLGPNGAVWYALQTANAIGTMTPTGTVTTYPVPTAAAAPQGITLGTQDGNLWFTESGAGQLARITPAGTVTEWAIPTPAGGVQPVPGAIVSTPDGAVWCTDTANSQLVRFTPTALFSAVALPAGAALQGLTLDPAGNLWVVEQGLGQVAQVTAAGAVTSYPLPGGSAGGAGAVALGPDGSLFIGQAGGSITQVVLTVPTDQVAVTATSGTAQVAAGMPLPFFAQVTGSPDPSVVWSIEEGASGGTVSATGLYTAPAKAGTYHVVAASHADPMQTATTKVTVTQVNAPLITVPTYVTAGTANLTATVAAQADATYVWTLTGGTITAGAGTPQITFTAGASGYVETACTVTNATLTASATGTAVSTIVAAPVIASLTANPTTISSGARVALTATFTGGGGVIDQGIGTVVSGVPVTTGALTATTTFSLTVTNAAGLQSKPATVQVVVH